MRRLRQGCLVVLLVACGVGLAAFLSVRSEIARFNALVEKHSSQPYPNIVLGAVLAAEDPFFLHRSRFDTLCAIAAFLRVEIRNALGGPKIVLDLPRAPITERMIRWQVEGRQLSRFSKTILTQIFVDATVPRRKILNAYVDHVYLGKANQEDVFGFREAARAYFGVTPEQLTTAQVVVLAAAIRRPAAYGPADHSRNSITRRLRLLDEMLRTGAVGRDEYLSAREQLDRATPDST